MADFKIWLKELRAEFLTASVVPVLFGTVIAWRSAGLFDAQLFVLALAGAVFLHLGTNVANDYYDHRSGNDALNTDYIRPFTGGSRLIQEDLISPGAVLTTSICFFAAACAVGAVLAILRGPVILLFGAAGLVSGYFYVAPPFRFAHRGIGEFLVGLNFGLLTVTGAFYIQTGRISAECIVASLPLALLIIAVILINEFQDSNADARVGKNTLIVRLGTKRGVILYGTVACASYLPILIGAAAGLLPPLTLIAVATLPLVLKAIATARAHHNAPVKLAPANASTILSHLVTGLLMVTGYFLAG